MGTFQLQDDSNRPDLQISLLKSFTDLSLNSLLVTDGNSVSSLQPFTPPSPPCDLPSRVTHFPRGQRRPEKLKHSPNQCLILGKANWFSDTIAGLRRYCITKEIPSDIRIYGTLILDENYVSGNCTWLHVLRVNGGGRRGMALGCDW